jgi:hypothetical protein
MDNTNPLKHANTLKREANYVLERVKVNQILASYGKVTPTGSYFLDTMVYPDIDLYLSKVSIPTLFEIGGKLAAHELTTEIVFEKSSLTALPGGLYLKARFDYGEWGRPWKVDIWSLEDSLIEERTAEMTRLQKKMTATLRESIIRYKLSVMTDQHRTPRFSGYFIYKAFMDEGLRDFEAVTRYLIENGIEMG